MKALVTGASGFLGQALVRSLVADGVDVFTTTRTPLAGDAAGTSWARYPVDAGEWIRMLEGIDVVYHLAWSTVPKTSNTDPLRDVSENIVPTMLLIDAAKTCGSAIVFASSGGTIYGLLEGKTANEEHPTKPITAYGVSKLAIEGYLGFYGSNYGLPSISLRISNPYGVGFSSPAVFGAVYAFANAALRGETITVFGDGTVVRDYIFLDDVVAVLKAAGRKLLGPRDPQQTFAEAINVGTGVGTSLNEVIKTVQDVVGRKLVVNYIETRQFDVPYSVLDIRRAKTHLHWVPLTEFSDGVSRTINILKRSMELNDGNR